MPPIFRRAPGKSELLIVIVVNVLTTLNVAMSVLLVAEVAPGKVPAPVLQLVCRAVGSQLPLLGAASHDADAARPRSENASRIDAASVANNAIRESAGRNKLFIVWLG